ncbi:MAG: HAD family hydrolase [Oscillospiraceae bacterium]|nr:HAD family hydrolase [Oscillospiraceae bacterium]
MPEGFFELVEKMQEKGVVFVAASGRQYYGVERVFEPVKDKMMFIAENGGIAFEHGKCVYSLPMADEGVLEILRSAGELYGKGVRVLLSGEKSAYVSDSDPEFAESCGIYCGRLTSLERLEDFAGNDRIIKIALFDKNAEEQTYPAMKRFSDRYNVILSNTQWVDIVDKNVNKGNAVKKLMDKLGAGFDEAMVFGDYLNDLEMMSCCKYSFAMENAHPILKENAAFIAPSNDENGVVKEILRHIPELSGELAY